MKKVLFVVVFVYIFMVFLPVAVFSSSSSSKSPTLAGDGSPKPAIPLVHEFERINLDENEPLMMVGKVGRYGIEMEITGSNKKEGNFAGRYRYASQTGYLQLSGQVFDSVLEVKEYDGGTQTGTFILEKEGDSITGWWFNHKRAFPVSLAYSSGDKGHLEKVSIMKMGEEVSDAITGTYRTEHYFINDFFATEDNPVYEVGFSGGTLVFEDAGDGNLWFNLEMVMGPTYHFAVAEGKANKTGNVHVYEEMLYHEESCIITFRFYEKTVKAQANDSVLCGFGARAFVDHTFFKVKD